jgi:hypothetical protein
MKNWWMGWTFPDEYADDERVAQTWPAGVKGWRSGYGEGYTTWCGHVIAESEERAKEKILSAYGPLAEHVEWRWDPEERPADWKPGSRFP